MTISKRCYQAKADNPDLTWSGIAEKLNLWPQLHKSQRATRATNAARQYSIYKRAPWPPKHREVA